MDETARPMQTERRLIRWENPMTRRYYQAWAGTNLFAEWEVFVMWGGIGTKRGHCRALPAADLEDASRILDSIANRRKQRKYQRVDRHETQ